MKRLALVIIMAAALVAPAASQAKGQCHSIKVRPVVWQDLAPGYLPGQIHKLSECNVPALTITSKGPVSRGGLTNVVAAEGVEGGLNHGARYLFAGGPGWRLGWWAIHQHQVISNGNVLWTTFTFTHASERVTFNLWS
jgi:hypothetical protein